MSVGDIVKFVCPSSLAYKEKGFGNKIPPNTDLLYELHLVMAAASSGDL